MTRGELMVLSWGKGPCQDLARNADNGLDDFLFVIPILAQSPAHMTPSHPQTRHRSFCLSRWEEASENELWDVDDSSWLWICSRLATNGFRCLTLINWRARQSRAWCWSYLRPINWNKTVNIGDVKMYQVTTSDWWGDPNKRRSGLTIFNAVVLDKVKRMRIILHFSGGKDRTQAPGIGIRCLQNQGIV